MNLKKNRDTTVSFFARHAAAEPVPGLWGWLSSGLHEKAHPEWAPARQNDWLCLYLFTRQHTLHIIGDHLPRREGDPVYTAPYYGGL